MTPGGPAEHRRALGPQGDGRVAAWYESRGYEVVARHWRCRDGELDLIVRQGRRIVFCEVKTRTTPADGAPAEAVTGPKQVRIRRLAARWLQEAPMRAVGIRFDVAAVAGSQVEVIEGAF